MGKQKNKRYYFLQLPANFFSQLPIKKLRRLAGGDRYTIIYLKMQLLSLENGGILFYEGLEDDIYSELALTLDESLDDVRMTFLYLLEHGLVLEEKEALKYFLPQTAENIGSITDSALRSRKSRYIKKGLDMEALQCNTNAAQLQQDLNGVLQCNITATNGNIEREGESNTELHKNKEGEQQAYQGVLNNIRITFDEYQQLRLLYENPDKLIDYVSTILPNCPPKDSHYAFILKIAMQEDWVKRKQVIEESESLRKSVPMPDGLREKIKKMRG